MSSRFLLHFKQGALLSSAPDVITGKEEREKEHGSAVKGIALETSSSSNSNNNYIFIFVHLFVPSCGVQTGLFGGLFGELFAAALLSIFNGLIHPPGGDTIITIFNGLCDPGSGATIITVVDEFFSNFNRFKFVKKITYCFIKPNANKIDVEILNEYNISKYGNNIK